jgi:RimJ/RimL family protein N-acetyltransferase
MDTIRIVPTDETYLASYHHCLDVVASERRYIALVEAPPLEGLRAFVRAVLNGAGVHLVAVDEADKVLGWCDVLRSPLEGFRHSGHLGMGLLPSARGKGVGRRLAEGAIASAWERGMERIELEVFASNEPAAALYRKLGFTVEGVRRRSRKLDGRYDDNVFMALLREPGA